MKSKQTTISIKLPYIEDELYTSLLKPLQSNGKLTALILRLLNAYFEDDFVRQRVDADLKNQLEMLQEEMQRIHNEHMETLSISMQAQNDIDELISSFGTSSCATDDALISQAEKMIGIDTKIDTKKEAFFETETYKGPATSNVPDSDALNSADFMQLLSKLSSQVAILTERFDKFDNSDEKTAFIPASESISVPASVPVSVSVSEKDPDEVCVSEESVPEKSPIEENTASCVSTVSKKKRSTNRSYVANYFETL